MLVALLDALFLIVLAPLLVASSPLSANTHHKLNMLEQLAAQIRSQAGYTMQTTTKFSFVHGPPQASTVMCNLSLLHTINMLML